MKNLGLLCILTFCSLSAVNAQTRYIVRFKDKGTNPFTIANPSAYLSQRSLDRRTRYTIAIDSFDLPITPRYIDSVRLAGAVTLLNRSKWLNQVAIRTTDATALTKINSLPFVISTTPVAARSGEDDSRVNKIQDTGTAFPPEQNFFEGTAADVYNYGLSHGQVHLHRGEFLHNHGFRGQGMQMVILDGGFFHYQTLKTFDSIRNNGQILGTWDFVANELSVNEDDPHGMQCLSTIGANIPGSFVGTAPKTSFYLYRTEDVASEYQIEEQNFVAGLERADSIGVDICSASLGYYQFDGNLNSYTYADMNGNTTISARGSDRAAQKGIMMVVAAGNEGQGAWHYIITPSDGDSVMAVGAVDTNSVVAAFSSYGPSSDGQVKPNLAATGLRAVIANSSTGDPGFGNGTSFATPNLAGLTTCLMQAYPEYNNMTILDAMQRSATKFNTPDVRVGYGIPDMKKSFVILQKKSFTQQAVTNGCNTALTFKLKTDNSMNVVIERKTSTDLTYTALQTFTGGSSYAVNTFNFTDALNAVAPGNIIYRVRVDIGTDTTYFADSIVTAVPALCSAPENSVRMGPNPVISDLNLIINRASAAKVEIMVHNASGQRIFDQSYQQAIGAQIKPVNLRNVSAGVYYVTVLADGKKIFIGSVIKK